MKKFAFNKVDLKSKRYTLDLINIFSGDENSSTHGGDFCANINLGDCAVKRVTGIKVSCYGSSTLRLVSGGKTLTFPLKNGSNDFKTDISGRDFILECVGSEDGFYLSNVQFIFLLPTEN